MNPKEGTPPFNQVSGPAPRKTAYKPHPFLQLDNHVQCRPVIGP